MAFLASRCRVFQKGEGRWYLRYRTTPMALQRPFDSPNQPPVLKRLTMVIDHGINGA